MRRHPPLLLHLLQTGAQTVRSMLARRFTMNEVVQQIYEFGNASLGIVTLCVAFMGVIIFLEYSYHVKLVISNDSLVPGFAMIMLTRELAPAITALLLVSKMGASIAAELGAMKTTEQLDAYRLLGLNPIDLFVTPKVIAAAVATLLLSTIALFIALIGGWIACVTLLGFASGTFFQNLLIFTSGWDFALLVIKSILFGACIPIISATFGFRCQFGSEGVGMTTTDAVVANSIWILIMDFLITYIFSVFQ